VPLDSGAHGVTSFVLTEDVSVEEEEEGALEVIFENGHAGRVQTLAEIRERLLRS